MPWGLFFERFWRNADLHLENVKKADLHLEKADLHLEKAYLHLKKADLHLGKAFSSF